MSITLEGLKEEREMLDRLLMSNPDMEKRMQDLIRKVLKYARTEVSKGAKSSLPDDPRHAYKAVKMAIYKRILGGSVSILNRRRASGKQSTYEPPRTLQPGQRGGNRVPRGARTQQVMSYYGADRAFILRWLNRGNYKTRPREAGKRGGRLTGSRGNIVALNWFEPVAQQALNQAIERLEQEFYALAAKKAES